MSVSTEWGPTVEGFKWLRPRLPGGTFYIFKSAKDKTSLGTKDEAEAKRRYVERIGQPLVVGDRNASCEKAFAEWIDEVEVEEVTRDRYRGLWTNYAAKHLGGKLVGKVEPRHIVETLRASTRSVRTGKPLSEQSQRHLYTMLSSFFTSCTEEPAYRPDNPVARIGKRNRPAAPASGAVADEVVISEEEIEEISAWFVTKANMNRRDERIRALVTSTVVLVMPWLGGRLGEILGLKVTDWNRLDHQLDPEAHPFEEITIERKVSPKAKAALPATWYGPLKGKKGTVGSVVRIIPVTPKVSAILGAYVALGLEEGWLREDGPLFPNAAGNPNTVNHISAAISEAASAVLGRRYTSHYFRHTFASRVLQGGGDLQEISELLGNSVEVCRTRYAHRANRAKFNARIIGLLEAGSE